jgi:hypothetical protein
MGNVLQTRMGIFCDSGVDFCFVDEADCIFRRLDFKRRRTRLEIDVTQKIERSCFASLLLGYQHKVLLPSQSTRLPDSVPPLRELRASELPSISMQLPNIPAICIKLLRPQPVSSLALKFSPVRRRSRHHFNNRLILLFHKLRSSTNRLPDLSNRLHRRQYRRDWRDGTFFHSQLLPSHS